jgi:ubiquinone/menaquinone biosynthesis C-methylase UbiE
MEADACQLPGELKNFDAVLMANLLCRLPDPRASLESMGGARSVVAPGGILALVSPYSWLEQHTKRDSWLGARLQDARPVSSADEIKKILGSEFELIEEDNLPLMIREHERKYQYIVSHLMIWRRKGA